MRPGWYKISAAAGLPEEPTARDSLAAGVDLVMASGDKLLGGPQAGLLLGKRDFVEPCRKHALSRALRPDKMLLAALEATLQLYRQGRASELPALRMLGASAESLRQRATKLALLLGEKGLQARVVECEGQVGGGSLPQARLPSTGVALDSPRRAEDVLAGLRRGASPVLALVRDGAPLFDVRCIADEELGRVAECAAAALAELAAGQPEGAESASEAESARLEDQEER